MIQLIFIFGRVCSSHYTISEIRFEARGFLKSVIKNIKYQISYKIDMCTELILHDKTSS